MLPYRKSISAAAPVVKKGVSEFFGLTGDKRPEEIHEEINRHKRRSMAVLQPTAKKLVHVVMVEFDIN